MNIVPRSVAAATLGLALCTIARAAPITDPRAIERAAVRQVQAEVERTYRKPAEVEAKALDPRLRLAPCGRFNAFLAPGTRLIGNVHVGVRCEEGGAWLVYVPVRISVHDSVITAAAPLARGQVLGPEHLAQASRDIAAVPAGYMTEAALVAGMRLKQPVAAGAVLTKAMFESPALVRRGERVTLVAAAGGIEVRAAGTALADAAKGEPVEVRNASSQRVVKGVVAGPGLVESRP